MLFRSPSAVVTSMALMATVATNVAISELRFPLFISMLPSGFMIGILHHGAANLLAARFRHCRKTIIVTPSPTA